MTDVVIYGATGTVGRLASKVLHDLGVTIAVAGRDRPRLEDLASTLGSDVDVRPAPVHASSALQEAFSDTRIVINCAGPFSKLGEQVLAAAISNSVHYLDIAAEQAFVREMFERYESPARKAGIVIVNGFGFQGGLGDWMATLAARELDGAPLDEISVSYLLDQFKTTAGTQLSALTSLECEASVWTHDRWEGTTVAAESRPVRFPEPFGMREAVSYPTGEVITVPRHIQTHRAQTYISIADESPLGRIITRGASLVGPLMSSLLNSPLGAFARAKVGEISRAPNEAQRQQSRFAILARAERSFERREVALVGKDPYAVCAEVVAHGATCLLRDGPIATGVLAPSQAFDPDLGVATVCERANLNLASQS